MEENRYIFDTHYGRSTLVDTVAGLRLTWTNGEFNESQEITLEPGAVLPEKDPELLIARAARLLGEYVLENYPELI